MARVTLTFALAVVALTVLTTPARAQSDYAGLPLPAQPSEPGAVAEPSYVGIMTAVDPGGPAGYVGLGAGYVGLKGQSASSPGIQTAAAPTPSPVAGAPVLDAAVPTPSEELPPVVTGQDIATLAALGGGALIASAVLVGRRRLS